MNKLFIRWQIYEKKVKLPNIKVFYQIFKDFHPSGFFIANFANSY